MVLSAYMQFGCYHNIHMHVQTRVMLFVHIMLFRVVFYNVVYTVTISAVRLLSTYVRIHKHT